MKHSLLLPLLIRISNHIHRTKLSRTKLKTPKNQIVTYPVQEGNEVNVAYSTLQGTLKQTESTSKNQTKKATPSVALQGDYHKQEEKEDNKVHEKEKPVASVTSSRKLDLQATKKTKTKSDTYAYTVIDDDCPDPLIWLTIHNSSPDDPESKLTLYRESKSSILD